MAADLGSLLANKDPGTTVRLKPELESFIAIARVSTTTELVGRASIEFSLNTTSTSVSTSSVRNRVASLNALTMVLANRDPKRCR